MAAKRTPPGNLKLENYSDREILHLIDDLGDEQGWVSIGDLAQRIGIVGGSGMSDKQKEMHARRCVAIRLGWIKRLSGTVERTSMGGEWRLTQSGTQVVTAKIASAASNSLDQMSEASLLHALDIVSRRYNRAAPGAANLMRREWAYGTHKNRRLK